MRVLRVKDPSTARIYFLRVPPTIERADDACAWTFGFDVAKTISANEGNLKIELEETNGCFGGKDRQ